jgi:D-alanyl-D-alanine carboxypeptidase/D-alanyl-D-alanine-endopeptidase (penicillin-binding protein 4)
VGIGDRLRVPGRGLRRALGVLTVLVLAAGLGIAVSLSAPTLVQNLGLSGPIAPAAPPEPVPALGPLPTGAPAPSAAGIAALLDEAARELPGEFTAAVVDPADRSVLGGVDPDAPLVPGSTAKVLTGAAALLTLDPGDGFVTRVLAGSEPGTVVLVGGGDPTLTALPEGEVGTYPSPSRLGALADAVRAASPGPVERVLVDLSRWSGPELAEGWDPADVGGGYITPIVPAMLDGGRADPDEQDGARVTDPGPAAGRALAELLGADPDAVEEGTAPSGAEPLGEVVSAPFSVLVEHVMRSSDNVLAEALAREVALARGGDPTFDGAAEQTLEALNQAGFDPAGVVLHDGSGLSRLDRVPARLLGELVAAAAAPTGPDGEVEFLRPLVTGLPVAGGDGTLDERFGTSSDAAAGRGVVRAKTGTLTGVSSLAGIVVDADGRLLVFALMSNGVNPATIRPELDALAAELAACGCR